MKTKLFLLSTILLGFLNSCSSSDDSLKVKKEEVVEVTKTDTTVTVTDQDSKTVSGITVHLFADNSIKTFNMETKTINNATLKVKTNAQGVVEFKNLENYFGNKKEHDFRFVVFKEGKYSSVSFRTLKKGTSNSVSLNIKL